MIPSDTNAEFLGLIVALVITYAVAAFVVWKLSRE